MTNTLDSVDYAYNTSIAVDSNNKVHISYSTEHSDGTFKYATNLNGSWVTTNINYSVGGSFGATGAHSSIAIDSNNKVHISYYNAANGDLEYATTAP